ncbi:MAG: hypothetical protein R3F30_07075 [Planctomycetota bacterium]
MIRKLAILAAILVPTALVSAQVECTVTPFGRGCGPRLTGKVTDNDHKVFDHALLLATTDAPAHSIGLTVIGLEQTEWKLPFMACAMLVSPHGIVLVRSDKDGNASASIPFPARDGLTAHLQQCWFQFGREGVKAVNSNGVTLSCKDSK